MEMRIVLNKSRKPDHMVLSSSIELAQRLCWHAESPVGIDWDKL